MPPTDRNRDEPRADRARGEEADPTRAFLQENGEEVGTTTLPGIGPPPPPPAAAPADGDGDDYAEDVEAIEALDDSEIEELDVSPPISAVASGELLGQSPASASSRDRSAPWSMPDSSPLPPPPPAHDVAAELPSTVALDEALDEARAAPWSRRASELRAELEAEVDRARAALVAYELGELSERRLRDEAGAVKAFGRALQSDPSLRPNLWAIRRIFYRRGLWPNLLKLIDAEVRFARSDGERADLLVEKAHVLEDKLGDRAGAREAFERAIALDMQHLGALLGRERQALAERDNEALAHVWELLAGASTSPARKVGYLVDRARLLAALALAGPPDQARPQLQEALDVIAEAGALAGAPGVDASIIALERERIAELTGDPEDQLAAADVRVALLSRDPTRARDIVAIRRRQARLQLRRGDRMAALRYLEEAAALAAAGDPAHPDPLLLFDLADVAEEMQGDQAADAVAADALERLGRSPLFAGLDATRRLALDLRRADALERAGHADEAHQARAAIGAAAPGFLPVLVVAEREALPAADLARIAALRLEEAQAARDGTVFGPGGPGVSLDDEAARRIWAAAAQVSAGDIFALDLGRSEDARAAYEGALVDLPGYGPAVEALASLHLADGRGGDAVSLLEGELDRVSPERAEELLERLAVLYEQQRRPADAIGAHERLLRRRPADRLTRHRLAELYGAAGRHAERAALLAALAQDSPDPAGRAALLFEVGRLREEALGDGDGAIAAYRQALSLADPESPNARIARGALLAALRKAGRWEELAAELRAEASLDAGPGGQRALRTAAAIVGRRLGQRAAAAELLRDLLDRVPDDLPSLRGLASALIDSGRPDEAAPILEREASLLAEGDAAARRAAAESLLRLGELYERLGRDADAGAALRRARELGQGDARLSAHAFVAMGELGARTRDRELSAEAAAGLAASTADDVLRADLLEELAWLGADDADAAGARFDEVLRLAPDRRGAGLGRALVAARAGDAGELAAALVAQASRTTDPTVTAALLMRAASLTDVAHPFGGDGAAQLAARALSLLPEDAGALVAAAERTAAGGDAAARAELLVRRAALADDPAARAALDLERAETLERAGRLAGAGAALLDVLRAVPDHLGALFALRRVARRGGDLETLARANYQLGASLADPALAAAHLAEAAALLDGEIGRPDDAAVVWRRVFELTPEHATAFRRAHELLQGAGDAEALIGLLSRKIDSLGPSAEALEHRLERAALHRSRDALDAASEDLGAALELDPAHVGALRSLSEVRLLLGDTRGAADLMAQYNETVTDPDQRAEGELRLAGLLEELDDHGGAISALDIALTAREGDLAARERLVELLVGERNHARAAEELEKLASRRPSRAERARDELRAARMFRDQVEDLPRSRAAYQRCLEADPLALEPLRELAALSDGAARAEALERAIAAVRATVSGDDPLPLRVLATQADLAGDDGLAFSANGALEALGAARDEERRRYLAERGRRVAQSLRATRSLSDEDWRARLEAPGLRGPLLDAWSAVAESAARMAEVDPAQLGFTRGDRIAWKSLGKSAPAVEAAARIFGLGEIDVHVTGGRTGYARTVALETPMVLLSADVARGESLEARSLLGRALASVRLRSGAVEEAGLADGALLLAGGLKAAGVDPAKVPAVAAHVAGTAARIDEKARAVAKTMSRKDRKALAGLADKLAQPGDLEAWLEALRKTLRRAALLLGGDLPLALGTTRGLEAADLIAFAVGEAYLHLRKDLGI